MKNILLLGAGASIPFYSPRLSTQHLTQTISDQDRWKNLVERFTNIIGKRINMVNIDTIFQLLKKIIERHPKYNFEQIIEIFDKITSFNFNPLPNSKIFHDILLQFGATAEKIPGHVWDCVPFLFRQIMTEEIADLHANHKDPNYENLIGLQTDFAKSISDNQNLNIFTLNYDETILDAIQSLGIDTGFDNLGRFDLNKFLSSAKTISFPHGHSRFSFDDDGILYHSSSQVANQHRLNNIGSINRTQTKYLTDSSYSYSFNTFISTGQQKEPTFDFNPYATYYQKFASDCLTANRIYVIGCSFADPHFNRMLLNFLKISAANKIVIVDYLPNQINIAKEFGSPGSLIQRIFSQLGVSSIPMNNNGINYFYNKEEDDLNHNGYSFINPQIFLYKKGYDSFLNEHKTITI